MSTSEAWKTPRGARPNRRGEPARLDEQTRASECAPSATAKAAAEENPRVGCWSHGASRDLDEGSPHPASVYVCRPHRIRLTWPVRYFSTTYGHFVRLQPTLSIEREGCGPGTSRS